LKKAVESALNQSFNAYEIVLIDDGSTDNTKDLLNTFNNQKLRIFHQENKGMIQAGYDGLKEAKGGFVCFLDGDDEFGTSLLSELFASLIESNDAIFAYSDYIEKNLANGEEKIISCENIFNTLACGVLWKKCFLDKFGFWDTSMIFPEHDFLLKVLNKNYKGVHVAKPLWTYNKHASSFTANKEKVEKGKHQLFKKYGDLAGFKDY